MAKAGNGEGSIFKVKDRALWVGMLTVRKADGKRGRKRIFGKTRAAVATKLRALLNARDKGAVLRTSDRETFAAFAERWLAAASPTLRDKTARRYGELLRLHALPAMGHVQLARLQPTDLQRLYEARRKAGAAPRTVLHLHRVIHRCLRDAERWGDAPRNVARLIDAPKAPRTEMQALTAEQARALLAVANGDRLEALLVVLLNCGPRLGEALGLTWGAVDLADGSLRIQASLQPIDGLLRLAEPKTARSRRQIELEGRVVAALRRHRAAQELERRVAGDAWKAPIADLVFTTETGDAIDGRKLIRSWFRPLLKRAGLPPIRLHDLRHSYASIALARGIHPRVVQEALGHATIAVTMDTYSHYIRPLGREAAREMGAALFGS